MLRLTTVLVLTTVSSVISSIVLSRFKLLQACDTPYGTILSQRGGIRHEVKCALICHDNYMCNSFLFDSVSFVCRLNSAPVPTSFDTSCTVKWTYGSPPHRNVSLGNTNTTCQVDADCTTLANTDCLEGECRCKPGYSYSSETDQCQNGCTVYGETFQTFFHYKLWGNNELELENVTSLQACLGLCLAEETFNCISGDYVYTNGNCHLAVETALTLPDKYLPSDRFYHFQRNCV